ncbi:MAG: alpha/beta hydrolase [Oscillatoriales cyanobacterium RM2_1_1]|nr:alpha/beta hydrolase [Oscillatoriales cyanobacterium SM2_3_0]NJO46300.1 alpha/beta hydrolase [Oscillatoriales cyanobacterium RM2_1_1]
MTESLSIWGQIGILFLGFLVGVYLLACLVLRFGQSRLIFFPSPGIQVTPDQVGLPYQEVWIPLGTALKTSCKTPAKTWPEPGEMIHGWWIPAKSVTDERVILDLHGNRNNIGANLGYAQLFHSLGLSVLLMDYRGYGRSSQRFPSEETVYQDVEAAWNYLVQDRQVDPKKIFVFGHSLGGAIAIHLATKHPEIAGLIVECSFTSIRRMVDHQQKYWMFPIDFLLTQRFDSIAKVSSLSMPTLFTHGTEDQVIPLQMTQELYAASPEPKQLLVVPGAGHNNVAQVGGDLYQQVVQQFLQQT